MANESAADSLTSQQQIEVFGADLDGCQFIEQTRTLKITRDGAILPLANKLATDCELIIRNPATNEEAIARVVDLVHDAVFVQVYAVAFIKGSENLWPVETTEAQTAKTVVLECSKCHVVDAVSLSEIEKYVFELKQKLPRHCECTNFATIWEKTDRRVTARRVIERRADDAPQDSSPAEDPDGGSPGERRKEKRTSVKAAVCIRWSGREIVTESEDMSRGGFRFKSWRAYPSGTTIEAAVPYAKNSTNIFVHAVITYQDEIADGSFRHGVSYVDSVRKFF